jgi:hypothetical protein
VKKVKGVNMNLGMVPHHILLNKREETNVGTCGGSYWNNDYPNPP